MSAITESSPRWRPVSEYVQKDHGEVILIAPYPGSLTNWTDIYHGWPSLEGAWARWPHTFPPTHFMKAGVPGD